MSQVRTRSRSCRLRVFADYDKFTPSGLISDVTTQILNSITHNVYRQMGKKACVSSPLQVQHRCLICSEYTVLAKYSNEKCHYKHLLMCLIYSHE